MIDAKDGSITITAPRATLRAAMTRAEFLSGPLAAIAKPLNQNAPWSRYSCQPVVIGGEKVAANICFKDDRLHSVGLAVIRPEFGLSWDDWSEEREQARREFHDGWLKTMLGAAPYSFAWGTVLSSFDSRSGGSDIHIAYSA